MQGSVSVWVGHDDLYPGHTLGALRFRSTPTGLQGRKLGWYLRHLGSRRRRCPACKPSYPSSVYDTRLPGIFSVPWPSYERVSIRQSSTDLLALKLLSRRPSHYSWRSRWDDTGMVTGRCFRSKRLGVSCWTRGYAWRLHLQSVGVGHAIRPIAGLRAVSDEGGVFDVVVNVGGGLGAVRRQGNPSSRLWFGDHQRRKAVMSTPARQAPSYGHSSIHLRHHPSAFQFVKDHHLVQAPRVS